MIPAISPNHNVPINPLSREVRVIRETAHHRKLVADLTRIRTLFQPNMRDDVSQIIQQWHTNFTMALRKRRGVQNRGESDGERFNRILTTHLGQMQERLRDPITNTPLDRDAVLGSDGETYGFKSLCLAISRLPAEYAHSSPLHPDALVPFTQRAHPLARHMVGFLAEWNALEHSQALEEEFNAFFHNHPLPIIPETPEAPAVNRAPVQHPPIRPQQNRPRMMTLTALRARDAAEPPVNPPPAQRGPPRMMTLADLRAQDAEVPQEVPPQLGFSEADLANLLGIIDEQELREAEDAQHQEEENAAFAQNLDDMIGAVLGGIQQEFAPIRERREEFAAEVAQVIQDYQAQNDADIEELQNEIDAISQEIADVTADIQRLPTHIQTLEHEILEAKKEDLELQRDIRQLDLAVKNKKKASLGVLEALVTSAVCIGLSALGAYALAYWFPNSIAAVTPMSRGALVHARIFV